MSTVANGASGVVRARMFPCGLMIHPTPPQAPVGSTRLDDRLKAPERTAATTPTDSHLAVVRSRRRARRQDDLHVPRGVGSVALHRPQLGADVEAERPRAGVVFGKVGITPVEPAGFPAARFIRQVELAAQRRQPAAG